MRLDDSFEGPEKNSQNLMDNGPANLTNGVFITSLHRLQRSQVRIRKFLEIAFANCTSFIQTFNSQHIANHEAKFLGVEVIRTTNCGRKCVTNTT